MKRASLLLCGGLACAIAILTFWPGPPPVSHVYFGQGDLKGVEIIAHGGGLGHAPPNTLYALQRAREMGADVLEVDVQQTRDGIMILRHDDTLDRTTDMSGLIADYDWQDISGADAGAKTLIDGTNFADLGIVIPTLAEALAAFPEARWILEIKNDTATAATTMCETIVRAGAADRVLVGSFHDAAMAHFRNLCPQVATSMASGEVRNFVIAARLGLSRYVQTPAVAMQIPVSAEGINLRHPRLLAAAKQRGIVVQYWTINDPEEMAALAALGADGLITDYVDRGLSRVTD